MFKIVGTHHSTVSSLKGHPKGVDQSHRTGRVRTNDDVSTVTQTDKRIDISLVRVGRERIHEEDQSTKAKEKG